jgi:ATP-dependent HslUV protease subunit HslV
MLPLATDEAHRCNGGRRIRLEPIGEVGIGPGPRHHRSAVSGANLMLVPIDDGIDGDGVDETLFDQDRLQRTNARRHFIKLIVVIVVVVVVHRNPIRFETTIAWEPRVSKPQTMKLAAADGRLHIDPNDGGPMADSDFPGWHGTTIIGVKKDGEVVVAGDGQVSLGQTVIKGTARKVRRLSPGGHDVVAGFAGSTADAFTLLERLEAKLEATPGQLQRACVELAKDWRTDKYLQKLEAMLIVTDGSDLLVVTGAGDVLEPEHGVAAIGSGGNFALAAARGMLDGGKDAETIARDAMAIAADICVYTNGNLTVERIAP